MGANFAARRRLFDRAGYFDEMLGGGGPLWSSQDYDLAYRAYQVGRRDPAAARGVRAPRRAARGRGLAEAAAGLRLRRRRVLHEARAVPGPATRRGCSPSSSARTAAKFVVKTILRRDATATATTCGAWSAGARASFKYGVDRRTRLYVER